MMLVLYCFYKTECGLSMVQEKKKYTSHSHKTIQAFVFFLFVDAIRQDQSKGLTSFFFFLRKRKVESLCDLVISIS